MKKIIEEAVTIAVAKGLIEVQDAEDFQDAVEDFYDVILETAKNSFDYGCGCSEFIGTCALLFNELYDFPDFVKSEIFKKMIKDIYYFLEG